MHHHNQSSNSNNNANTTSNTNNDVTTNQLPTPEVSMTPKHSTSNNSGPNKKNSSVSNATPSIMNNATINNTKKVIRTILAPPTAHGHSHSHNHGHGHGEHGHDTATTGLHHQHHNGSDEDSVPLEEERIFDVPIQHYDWGQPQVMPHAQWGGLFFDLVYVGVAYRLGTMLKEGLHSSLGATTGTTGHLRRLLSTTINSTTNTTDHPSESTTDNGEGGGGGGTVEFLAVLGVFIAMFSAIESCWYRKMSFEARFHAEDLVHRSIQIVLGCLTAVAALSIDTLPLMNQPYSPQAMTFSACLLAHSILDGCVYFELYLWGKTENSRGAGWISVTGLFIQITLFSIALALSSTGYSILGPAICWMVCPLMNRFHIIFLIRMGWIPRSKSVPMNVEFSAHRKGEFCMLMLGESIISIIIVPLHNSANFFATYCLSYFLVATICLLHFSCYPTNPNEHALRRSSMRALILNFMESMQAMTLIMTGVGFKVTLVATEGELFTGQVSTDEVWFFAASLAMTLLITICCSVMHHGPMEEFHLHSAGDLTKKCLLWSTKIIVIGLLLVAPYMNVTGTKSWGLLLYFTCLTQIVYAVHLVDFKIFRGHHLLHIQTEVLARMLFNLGVDKNTATRCAPAFSARGIDTHEALVNAKPGTFEACGMTPQEAKLLCDKLGGLELRHSFEKEVDEAQEEILSGEGGGDAGDEELLMEEQQQKETDNAMVQGG
jgi:hypothetical protein